ncbi:G-protein coupled receptor Mth-like 1 [Apis mellifera carnica]|nr:G-protein coupled receptor Mth-like 1 [Apis mellifera carnica]
MHRWRQSGCERNVAIFDRAHYLSSGYRKDLRPASLEKGQETLRLRVYACYAWGGPLLVAGLAALLDHLPPQPQYTFLRPRFGVKQCWFYDDMAILAYFFGPIGFLLAVNLLFFAATARELTCGLWKGEFVKSTTERAALGRVCMKLVVVMGVTWVADVVSWAVGGPQYIWYFTDMINAFQGVLIFAVVGCQPQVRAALKRICNRNPRTNAGRQGNGLSTTSHGMPSMGDSVIQNPSTKTAPLETIC